MPKHAKLADEWRPRGGFLLFSQPSSDICGYIWNICRYLQISTGSFKCLPASLDLQESVGILDICRYLWASGDFSHPLAGYLLIGWHIPKAYRHRQAAMKPVCCPKAWPSQPVSYISQPSAGRPSGLRTLVAESVGENLSWGD